MFKNRRRRAKQKGKRRARTRGAKAPTKRDSNQPVQMVVSLDGGPLTEDCACPVCADLARRGIPVMTIGNDGKMVEVTTSKDAPMIEITVRGTVSTWPELSADPRNVSLPLGCVVQDALEFLRYQDFGLQQSFPPGGLYATIRGRRCEDLRVVFQGDELRVFGERCQDWDAIAKMLTPVPD